MASLFKYIADPDVVQPLLKGIVKFTPIPELNDPSELTPKVDVKKVTASLTRLRQDGYSEVDMSNLRKQGCLFQRLAPDFQVIDVPDSRERATAIIRSSFYDSISVLETRLNETVREMSSKVGLLCLSRRYDSLPMWAHYAGNATGLVVEYIGLEKVFLGDDTGVLYLPIPVRYERENLGVTFDPQSHESLFFAKFRDRSYEQEVRVVIPLAEYREEFVDGKCLYLFDVPRTCLKRVILGWNMTPAKVKAVRAWAESINRDVEVVQALFADSKVAFS